MSARRGPGPKEACHHKGKRRFHDKNQAVGALHTIQSRGTQRERMPVRAYRCDFCNGWFLTSQANT